MQGPFFFSPLWSGPENVFQWKIQWNVCESTPVLIFAFFAAVLLFAIKNKKIKHK